jgi:hypothetical protein
MNAAILLREIEATGIVLHPDGDRVRADIPDGVSLDPFRQRIQACKPMLLRSLLERKMTAIASAPKERFDRTHLGQQWQALPNSEAEIAALADQLETGWRWMQDHPDHPEHEPFFDRWIGRLRTYERACTAHNLSGGE